MHGLVFPTQHVLVCSLLLFRNSYTSFYTVRFKTPFGGGGGGLEIVCYQKHFHLENLIYLTLSYTKLGHVDLL